MWSSIIPRVQYWPFYPPYLQQDSFYRYSSRISRGLSSQKSENVSRKILKEVQRCTSTNTNRQSKTTVNNVLGKCCWMQICCQETTANSMYTPTLLHGCKRWVIRGTSLQCHIKYLFPGSAMTAMTQQSFLCCQERTANSMYTPTLLHWCKRWVIRGTSLQCHIKYLSPGTRSAMTAMTQQSFSIWRQNFYVASTRAFFQRVFGLKYKPHFFTKTEYLYSA